MSVLRYVDTEELEIRNPLFMLHTESNISYTDTHAIGFVGKYSNGANVAYTGLFRDPTDSIFKVFQGATTTPTVDTGFIDTAGSGYALASMDVANFRAYGNLDVFGNVNITGDVVSINVSTLTVDDNIILANAGPANTKPDGGFVIRRQPVGISQDAAKESGTASASGTTTTIALQAAHGHGFTANYYKGWVLKAGGDATGSSVVLSSSTSNPPVLTLATALSAATSTATTYQLFNKQHVGTIYSESNKMVKFMAFPREDLMGEISETGVDGDGNLADLVDIKAKDLYLTGAIIADNAKFDDNIVASNVGPSHISEDSGYVNKRSPAFIVAGDAPKLAAVPIQASYTSGTTLSITSSASGTNYFKGWTIRYNADTANACSIVSSSNVGTTHTLVLSAGFPVALTAGTDTVDLYNKTFVGAIYDESRDVLMSVGFPREEGETVIDPLAPVNGNVPDYINTIAKDVTVKGYLYLDSATVINTKTQVAPVAFTAADIMYNDVIYLNPTADATFTMPATSSISLAANRSKPVVLVNLSAHVITIAANASDMFETRSQLTLTRPFSKTVLMASSELANTWFIRG
jgi:hypothetical protein